jgi:hypothetical protein
MSLEELVSDVLDPIPPAGADTLETITNNDEITTGSGWFSCPQLPCDLEEYHVHITHNLIATHETICLLYHFGPCHGLLISDIRTSQETRTMPA